MFILRLFLKSVKDSLTSNLHRPHNAQPSRAGQRDCAHIEILSRQRSRSLVFLSHLLYHLVSSILASANPSGFSPSTCDLHYPLITTFYSLIMSLFPLISPFYPLILHPLLIVIFHQAQYHFTLRCKTHYRYTLTSAYTCPDNSP